MNRLLKLLSTERGIAAPMFAMVLTSLLGVSALAVDMGNNWQEKRQLSNAVDAAALAAASDYAFGGQGCLGAATEYLLLNEPDAVLTSCETGGDTVNGTYGWVVVTADVPIEQHFGKVLGINEVTATVRTAAMWGIPATQETAGARPFAVCEETLQDNADYQDWLQDGGDSEPIRIMYDKENLADCTGSDEVCTAVINKTDIRDLVDVNGDASYKSNQDKYVLTKNQYSQAGTVMSTAQIDMREDFDIVFEVKLGNDDGGADGIGFVFHNDPAGANAIGHLGGGLGMAGIKNSIGIEFDTWHNGETYPGTWQQAGDDPYSDHTAIYDPEHVIDANDPNLYVLYGGATRLSPLVTLPNIEDNSWHTAEINWDASTEQLAYSFDGFQVAVLQTDLINDHFNGDFAYFGFAASTGGAKNKHQLRFETFDATVEGEGVECEGDEGGAGVPGNWGMIDFDGGNNSNNDTKDWIQNGYSGLVDAGTFSGDPGAISGSYASALSHLKASGGTFAIPIFSYAEGNGANAEFTVSGFVYGKLHDYEVNGSQSSRHLEVILSSAIVDSACCLPAAEAANATDVMVRATRMTALDESGYPVDR